jgi:hypothetical protein
MKTILIDTENISKKEEYEAIAELKRCKLIFFETKNTKNNQIPLSTAMKLSQSKVKIEFLHVNVSGKNALDFKICALAGKINKWSSEVYILSRDKGYDNLREFNIHRIESIKNLKSMRSNRYNSLLERIKLLKQSKQSVAQENNEIIQQTNLLNKNISINDKVKLIISEMCNIYENDTKFINNLVSGLKGKDKTIVNNLLQKKFRNSDLVLQKRLYKTLISTCI